MLRCLKALKFNGFQYDRIKFYKTDKRMKEKERKKRGRKNIILYTGRYAKREIE